MSARAKKVMMIGLDCAEPSLVLGPWLDELETIRGFLTGQGLSSAIDLLFTVVFIAVMFLYSTTLTVIVLASNPGRIVKQIDVDLARPRRQLETRENPTFLRLRHELHGLIGKH